MLQPSIDNLLKFIDSKYTLVTISARRARELKDLEKQQGVENERDTSKLVGVALEEIEQGKLTYRNSTEDTPTNNL
ncbi:DNA-directed RNA polymerase subunit omega [Aliibacillus thermotolerans]|uniref:DNA-directed RNA polymerase subunit omega n=1 Tax=Aliibacillus thermotolerans TaxID=1834418 RepID=A0ABW0U715_9BACI|nr:DNA-directed RNA polymerase subunit omega [Aliibacillus thermotolerans]MDA3130667.1 DNA-directed RNA polymerase subunit omega [Aliibacillus thermotolerans]